MELQLVQVHSPSTNGLKSVHDLDLDNDMITVTIAGVEVGSFTVRLSFRRCKLFRLRRRHNNRQLLRETTSACLSLLTSVKFLRISPSPSAPTQLLRTSACKGKPDNAMVRIHALNGPAGPRTNRKQHEPRRDHRIGPRQRHLLLRSEFR